MDTKMSIPGGSAFFSTFDNTHSENKNYNMKQFISAVGQYLNTRTEDVASIINRHLQLLSVAIDYSIFDPNTSIVCEFFVSLHELLSNLEPHSLIAWCCVNVLGTACRNAAARNALIHTYQFIPAMSRLLDENLSYDKKIRLLTVMQELSCGIKISWQIPHLSHLLSTLARWVEREKNSEQVVTLSLGVLVNLCYKNLPAIYTLSRCVEIKKFVRVCAALEGLKIEVNVVKLLIILEYIHGFIPMDAIHKLIDVTFKSITEAFQNKDAILLRQVVEFYLDVKKQNESTDTSHELIMNSEFDDYSKKVETLLTVIESKKNPNDMGDSNNEPECMALIFRFLHSIIELKLSKIIRLYDKFVNLAMSWIHTEIVCTEALSVLSSIVVNSNLIDQTIIEPLVKGVPIFLLAFGSSENNEGDEKPMNIEQSRRLSSIMLLLRALVQCESTRGRVIGALTDQIICRVFVPFLDNDESPRSRAGDANACTPEAINLYINTLVLINDLAGFSPDWVEPLKTLLRHKQMHMILAEALYGACKETKALILAMASYPHFPGEQIAACMAELQPLKQQDVACNNKKPVQNDIICYPMMSNTQSDKLDKTIQVLKETCAQNNVINISTSDVMELYEYKLSSMGHTERAAMASVEAASQRCTHLQHQTAQLTAELSRIRQLFIHAQQCSENLNMLSQKMNKNNQELQNRLDAEKGRGKVSQSMLANKDRQLQECEATIENYQKKLKDREAEKANMDESIGKLKKIIQKLEENLLRQERNAEIKDEIIKKTNGNVENYKQQVMQLEKQLKQSDMQLTRCNQEISNITAELKEKTDLIHTITRLTLNK